MHRLTSQLMVNYFRHLQEEERSCATLDKYKRDITMFFAFLPKDKTVDKSRVIAYKENLMEQYAPASVNSMLAAVNSFFVFVGWTDCRVKALKIQKKTFCERDKELTKEEYFRMLKAARQKKNRRLMLVMETLCSTGIRVSELFQITGQAVQRGRAEVRCKGKGRIVFLPFKLCRELERYMKQCKRTTGPVFVTRGGKPMDRSNIWREMKELCECAGILHSKVFPHNLRHLFARTYYKLEKDLGKLADLLGHSSVETTRIYTVSTGAEHERQVALLGLVI